MEPMTLGSPSGGSPAYLPSFLLGDAQNSSDSRNPATSPQEFNRSSVGQKVLFGTQYQQTPPTPARQTQCNTTTTSTTASGPPTTGLFDSLRNNNLTNYNSNNTNQVTTPKRDISGLQSPIQMGTPIHGRYQNQQHLQNTSAFGMNQSLNTYNDSYFSNASFNGSRSVLSPAAVGNINAHNASQTFGGAMSPFGSTTKNNFWITVFGFPPSSSTAILQHFTNCGTIVDKIFAPQNGNWMHIKFAGQSECARALNYNEKILFNNIMIGVTQCHEKSILEKENLADSTTSQTCRARPLTQSVYKPTQIVNSPASNNLRTTDIVNKAMELLFNW